MEKKKPNRNWHPIRQLGTGPAACPQSNCRLSSPPPDGKEMTEACAFFCVGIPASFLVAFGWIWTLKTDEKGGVPATRPPHAVCSALSPHATRRSNEPNAPTRNPRTEPMRNTQRSSCASIVLERMQIVWAPAGHLWDSNHLYLIGRHRSPPEIH